MNQPAQIDSAEQPTPARFTIEQFYRIAETGVLDGKRSELLAGEIVIMAPQWAAHGQVKSEIAFALNDSVRAQRSGLAVMVEASIELGLDHLPMPDIFIWERASVARGVPEGLVKLVIEVADSSERNDMERKRLVYAENHVAEYWVAVLRTRTIERFAELADGDYRRRDSFAFGDAVDSLTLAGIGIAAGTLA